MSALVQTLCVFGLGLFWGLSPTLSKLMGQAGIPITHIVVIAGLGVGTGLAVLRLLQSGRIGFDRRAAFYGFVCALLMNVGWCLGLYIIRKIPVGVAAVISATTPLFSYALALIVGRERLGRFRLLALTCGFLSSAVLIVSRLDAGLNADLIWVLIAFLGPIIWAFYNLYASLAWPSGMETLTAGVVESWASALMLLPVMMVLEPLHGFSDIHLGYWTLAAAVVLWTIERIAFFTLIRKAGAVTTAQATYVSTPASVVFGALVFHERADGFLLLSLGLLMLALWLNNKAVGLPSVPGADLPLAPQGARGGFALWMGRRRKAQ